VALFFSDGGLLLVEMEKLGVFLLRKFLFRIHITGKIPVLILLICYAWQYYNCVIFLHIIAFFRSGCKRMLKPLVGT